MRILNRVEFVNTCPKNACFVVFTPVSHEESNRIVVTKLLNVGGKYYAMGDIKIKGDTTHGAGTLTAGVFEYTSFIVMKDTNPLHSGYRAAYYTDENPREENLYGVLTFGEVQAFYDDLAASLESYKLLGQLAGN